MDVIDDISYMCSGWVIYEGACIYIYLYKFHHLYIKYIIEDIDSFEI